MAHRGGQHLHESHTMQQSAISIDRARQGGYANFMAADTMSAGLDRLIEEVRDALSSDLEVARRCLDRLSAVVNARSPGPTGQARLPLPPVKQGGLVKGGLASWQIRKIDEHVAAQLQTTISIGTLSNLTRLSNGHFCRAFKISMGETPQSYIRRARIERAQTMMMTSEASLSQIALACGLADQAHLTRLFRKYVGQTPLSWRRTWKTEA